MKPATRKRSTGRALYGWRELQAFHCVACHTPPLFTNDEFFHIGRAPRGLRPRPRARHRRPRGRGRDEGADATQRGAPCRDSCTPASSRTSVQRSAFTLRARDAGARRNSGRGPLHFNMSRIDETRHSRVPQTALVDPRVRDETFPFDRPRLRSEVVDDEPEFGATRVRTKRRQAPGVVLRSKFRYDAALHQQNNGPAMSQEQESEPPIPSPPPQRRIRNEKRSPICSIAWTARRSAARSSSATCACCPRRARVADVPPRAQRRTARFRIAAASGAPSPPTTTASRRSRRASLASDARSSGARSTRMTAAANCAHFLVHDDRPRACSRTTSFVPSTAVDTTGTPSASASSSTRPCVSVRDANTNTFAAR